MVIYAFEGAYELYVKDTVADAEGYFEAIDIENDEYVFFADDGTVIAPSVRTGRVVLTPTAQVRAEELRDRLRTYLSHPRVAIDPALADDPVALGKMLLERKRASQRPHRLLGWLDRRGN